MKTKRLLIVLGLALCLLFASATAAYAESSWQTKTDTRYSSTYGGKFIKGYAKAHVADSYDTDGYLSTQCLSATTGAQVATYYLAASGTLRGSYINPWHFLPPGTYSQGFSGSGYNTGFVQAKSTWDDPALTTSSDAKVTGTHSFRTSSTSGFYICTTATAVAFKN